METIKSILMSFLAIFVFVFGHLVYIWGAFKVLDSLANNCSGLFDQFVIGIVVSLFISGIATFWFVVEQLGEEEEDEDGHNN